MKQEKIILADILEAFCLKSENIKKVCELTGVKSIWNGKRTQAQATKLLVRALSEEQAKDVINKMPFPFIGIYDPLERPTQGMFKQMFPPNRDSYYWIEDVLAPINKRGRILSSVTHCGIVIK